MSLLPGVIADPLHSTLTHVALNISDTDDASGATDKDGEGKGEEPVYEALSYMWDLMRSTTLYWSIAANFLYEEICGTHCKG